MVKAGYMKPRSRVRLVALSAETLHVEGYDAGGIRVDSGDAKLELRAANWIAKTLRAAGVRKVHTDARGAVAKYAPSVDTYDYGGEKVVMVTLNVHSSGR